MIFNDVIFLLCCVQRYTFGTLEVCSWKLGRFPQIQGKDNIVIGLRVAYGAFNWHLHYFIILVALWVGKMNQILHCDWLPEQARWSYLARSGLPDVSHKKNIPKSHIINPLLTKVVRFKMAGYWPHSFFVSLVNPSGSINMLKNNLASIQSSWPHTWPITHL